MMRAPYPSARKIRVLVVDDSAVVRQVLSSALSAESDIEVVGTAADPYAARDRIVELEPDVMTLDIEMPRMDGLTFLEKLMKYHPMPVIVVSSLTPEGSETAFRALELGAVDVVPKPHNQRSIPDVGDRLAHAVRAAAVARIGARLRGTVAPRANTVAPRGTVAPPRGTVTPPRATVAPPRASVARPSVARASVTGVMPPRASVSRASVSGATAPRLLMTDKLFAVGASTGGTHALEKLLSMLPADAPGMIIVQHMPDGFTAPFAKRLDATSPMTVREARDGDRIAPGLALIAPAGPAHSTIVRSGALYIVRLMEGPRESHQRPSVDRLFKSVAESIGPNAIGALLTGMGRDGADGLLAMRKAGARTIAEDESTCVVYGMPRAAVENGGAEGALPLHQIPEFMMRAAR